MMRALLLLPLALVPLACDPPKPPTVSLSACRLDEDTARVDAWIVPRGKRVTLAIPGDPGEAGLSTTRRLSYEAPIDGNTLDVTVRIREGRDGPIVSEYVATLWATRPC